MMSDLQREALDVLTEVWKLSPDIRLDNCPHISGSWVKSTSVAVSVI